MPQICSDLIVHNRSSDHSILFASMSRKLSRMATPSSSKSKFDVDKATALVERLCNGVGIRSANELNIALQNITLECTTVLSVRSDERIVKSHVNRELILAICERDRLYALVNCVPDNDIIVQKHRDKERFVERLYENLKSIFESERIEASAGNDRKTWQLYKDILFNQTKKSETLIKVNGVSIDDSVRSCNVVNDYFCSAGENLATSIIAIHGYSTDDIEDLYEEHASNNWSFQHVSPEAVSHVINSLPNKTSAGLDNVPIKLLKNSVVSIALVIAACFNVMIDTATFPTELLKGRLKLIHKSGDHDIDNYRGLTLLPSLSKVFEELLLRQLVAYFESVNLFVGNQFGFLKGSRCQSAALQLVDVIKSNYNKAFVASSNV